MEQESIYNEELRTDSSVRSISDLYKNAWGFLKDKWLNAVLTALVAGALMSAVFMVYYFISYFIIICCWMVGFASIGFTDPSSFENNPPELSGMLIFIAVIIIGSLISYALLFLTIIFGIGPINYGKSNTFLISLRNNKEAQISDLLLAKTNYWGIVKLTSWQSLYILLWSLLFIIPGIIKAYAYSMSYYIRYDYPELTAKECLELSSNMMDGHKLDLFVLHLTFIGLSLLGVFTCGLANLGTIPFIDTITAQFYEDVKAKYEYNKSLFES